MSRNSTQGQHVHVQYTKRSVNSSTCRVNNLSTAAPDMAPHVSSPPCRGKPSNVLTTQKRVGVCSREKNLKLESRHTARQPYIFLEFKRILKSNLHPAIFWEMVKFADLGVLYFSLVLPREPSLLGCPEALQLCGL